MVGDQRVKKPYNNRDIHTAVIIATFTVNKLVLTSVKNKSGERSLRWTVLTLYSVTSSVDTIGSIQVNSLYDTCCTNDQAGSLLLYKLVA